MCDRLWEVCVCVCGGFGGVGWVAGDFRQATRPPPQSRPPPPRRRCLLRELGGSVRRAVSRAQPSQLPPLGPPPRHPVSLGTITTGVARHPLLPARILGPPTRRTRQYFKISSGPTNVYWLWMDLRSNSQFVSPSLVTYWLHLC